jgi:putative holliday junction resolvase
MPLITIDQLLATLPPRGRLLGVDLGDKTIGLALSDVQRMIATPFKTLVRGKFGADSLALVKITQEFEICGLVFGFPINMDGTIGPQAQSVRSFVGNLAKIIPLPFVLWDERMSTQAVTRTLFASEISTAKRKAAVDKMAASYILQGAMEFKPMTNREEAP